MKILLIEPPKTAPIKLAERTRSCVQPPMGLLYVGAMLEKNNYKVKILDVIAEDEHCKTGKTYWNKNTQQKWIRYGISNEEIKRRIREYNPDVVGISCGFSGKYAGAKEMCKLTKEIDPNCKTMMGGIHPTLETNEVAKDENLDYIIKKEGEYTSVDIIRNLENGNKVDRINEGKYIENLDELPFPARHLIPIEKYWEAGLPHGESTRKKYMTIYTSRGCPNSCIYCSSHLLWGKKYRGRSPKNVLEEIRLLIEKYKVEEILIEDDNFFFDKKRAEEILDGIIENRWDLTWTTPSGVDTTTLDRTLLEKIKRSGCESLTIAIESGSQRVLDEILKKPIKIKQAEKIVKICKELGLKIRSFFMLGIPGETKKEMNQTVALARKLQLDWSCWNITTPIPKTELYDMCLKKGYCKNIKPSDVEFTTSKINTKEFNSEYVNKLWEKANNMNFLENPNLIKGGNIDRAIRDFKRVLRIVPNHKLAKEALERAYKIKG